MAVLARARTARRWPPSWWASELHAVADAEHGQLRLEDVGGSLRRAFVVDAGRAAGEDEAARVERAATCSQGASCGTSSQ